jgi:hypothetical protein
MAAVGAVQAGEASMKVAAVEEGGDGGGGLGGEAGQLCRVVVENLPNRRGAGLAGAVADADQLGGRITLGVSPPRPRVRCTQIMG